MTEQQTAPIEQQIAALRLDLDQQHRSHVAEIHRLEQRRQQVESELRADLTQSRGEVASLRNALENTQRIMQEQGTLLASLNALYNETKTERDELRAILHEQIKELRPLRDSEQLYRMLSAIWRGYADQCVIELDRAGVTPPPTPQIPESLKMIEG